MPIYEYACRNCQKVSEFRQKLDDPAPSTCPNCGFRGPLSQADESVLLLY